MRAFCGLSANLEVTHQGVRFIEGVEKLTPTNTSMTVAGSSINIALSLRSWGWNVFVAAAVGKTGYGNEDIQRHLEAAGATCALLRVREYTPCATVLLMEDGHRHLIPAKPPVTPREYEAEEIKKLLPQAAGSHEAIHVFTSIQPDEVPLIACITDEVSGADTQRIVVSPGRRLLEIEGEIPLRFGVLFLGLEEMQGFWTSWVNKTRKESFSFNDLQQVLELYEELQLIILTMGNKGSIAITRGGMELEQPALQLRHPIVDTTGCGDAYLSAALVFLYDSAGRLRLGTEDVHRAMRAGAAAGAVKLGKLGGSTVPTAEEIQATLEQHPSGQLA